MFLRDKDYIATKEGLRFNVIGYDHPRDSWLATLKYIGDEKWTAGYHAAAQFLRDNHPAYARRHIMVPRGRVTEVWRPRTRMQELLATPQTGKLALAAELARHFSRRLEIDLESFGVTDSLLWGKGVDDSDIDLAVYGQTAVNRALAGMARAFDTDECWRLDHTNFSRSPSRNTMATEVDIRRRVNKGLFRGVRFSLRGVRAPAPQPRSWRPARAIPRPVELTTTVADVSESLYFPVHYTTDSEQTIVSFCTDHELLLRVGDVVAVRGVLERARSPAPHKCGLTQRIAVNRREDIRLAEPFEPAL